MPVEKLQIFALPTFLTYAASTPLLSAIHKCVWTVDFVSITANLFFIMLS